MYFLLDLIDGLDLSELLIPAQAKDPRGEKGFDPRMLLLYAHCVGVATSRKIERACYEDRAFRVLTGNQQPDHSRMSEFYRRNLDALKGLVVQILRLCQKAGMVSLFRDTANQETEHAFAHFGLLHPELVIDNPAALSASEKVAKLARCLELAIEGETYAYPPCTRNSPPRRAPTGMATRQRVSRSRSLNRRSTPRSFGGPPATSASWRRSSQPSRATTGDRSTGSGPVTGTSCQCPPWVAISASLKP